MCKIKKKYHDVISKMVLLSIIILNVGLLIGCGVANKKENSTNTSENDSSMESKMAESSGSKEEIGSLEAYMSEVMNGKTVSYEEAKKMVNDNGFEVDYTKIEYWNDKYGDILITPEECAEIEEVLSVYFKCLYNPRIWGNYDFVDDAVMERWGNTYNVVTESKQEIQAFLGEVEKIGLNHVFYHDEENYYIEVGSSTASSFYTYVRSIHQMHLKKSDSQWHIVKDAAGDYYGGFYSMDDLNESIAIRTEAFQKGRENNPITEELIQKAIELAIESYEQPVYGLTEEEMDVLRTQVEGLYNKSWNDKLLNWSVSSWNGTMPNFNKETFMIWIQPKEEYDESFKNVIEKVFGSDVKGDYFRVQGVDKNELLVERDVFSNLPDMSLCNSVKWEFVGDENLYYGERWFIYQEN